LQPADAGLEEPDLAAQLGVLGLAAGVRLVQAQDLRAQLGDALVLLVDLPLLPLGEVAPLGQGVRALLLADLVPRRHQADDGGADRGHGGPPRHPERLHVHTPCPVDPERPYRARVVSRFFAR
jgi:hypothetical protein